MYRARAGLTQARLAEKLGVHRNTVIAWENGTQPPGSRNRVLDLADALDLDETDTNRLLFALNYVLEHETLAAELQRTPRMDAELMAIREGMVRVEAGVEELLERVRPAGDGAVFQALHTLRAPVGDFTGRVADIEALVEYLSRNRETAAITGIRGMGGIGKTELALVVAHALRKRYPDAGLMFELQPGNAALAPEAALRAVIRAFQPEAKLPQGLVELQGICRAVLAGKHGVLLLDNAAGPEQVRPLLPAPAGWAVLVTSRSRFTLPGGKLHDLELLPLDDAMSLLQRLFFDGEREDLAGEAGLEALAEQCGRLPLALRMAAGYLTTYTDWLLADYLAALERARLKYLVTPGEEESVQTVLSVSIDRLQGQDSVLAERWKQLAIFPAPFDRAAVAAVWGRFGDMPGNDSTAWPTLMLLDEEETRQGMSALVQRNLLDYDAASETYRMHDLLRECALASLIGSGQVPSTSLEQTLEGARQRHAWHYLRLGQEAEDCYEQYEEHRIARIAEFEMITWPHLKAAWTWQRERLDELARRRPERIAQLCSFLALTSYDLGKGEENLEYLEQGLATLQRLEIPARWFTIDLKADWINAAEELGKLDSEESVVAYSNLLGEVAELEPTLDIKTVTAMIYHYRAIALGNSGREPEAAPDYYRAIELYKELENWYMVGTCYLNFASAAYARMCLEDFEERLAKGSEYSKKAGDLDNLNWAKALRGAVLRLRGQAVESERMLSEAIQEAEELGFRWNLVGMYVDLADALLDQGRAEEAKETAKQALDLATKSNEPLQIGWGYAQLGRAESALDNHPAAESYLRKAIEYHNKAKESHMVARAQGYLGQALLRSGQVEQGVVELMKAITTLEGLELGREAELFRISLHESGCGERNHS